LYQTGETIKSTIEQVQHHEFVLPAIQREFVWKPEQIQRLFDSLMQGIPVRDVSAVASQRREQ